MIPSGKAIGILLSAAVLAWPGSVESLLSRMTLEEKISLVHGARDPRELGQAGYCPGLPRLGIPPLRFADGPPGINVNRESTAMPAPVALAATFDPDLARLYGVVLGSEAKALDQDVVLAPYVNLVRDPVFRRNHTTLGEDPLLTARLAAAEVEGIQSQGVMAQVKHLAGYYGPSAVTIDERALHELYLPAFEAAVRAGAASVMCAYNRLNGPWSCESAPLLNDILRGEWSFRGFVTSDWGAVHSATAIASGVDLEMPGREIAGRGGPYFTDGLEAAVRSGQVPVRVLDEAVRRILEQMERFHLLERQAPKRPRSIDVEGHARIIRKIACKGAVLLKNDDSALPLSREDILSLAFIGPTAGQLATGFMGERGFGFEPRLVSPLVAFQKLAPGVNVVYWPGVDLTGSPLQVKGPTALEPGDDYSWSGSISIPSDGEYTFLVQPLLDGRSEGGGSISVDGQPVARTGGPGFGGTGVAAKKWSSLLPTTDGRDNGRGTLRLNAGIHSIAITAHSTGQGPLDIRFAWITPAMRRAGIDRAVALARTVRTPVVFAWSTFSGSLSLPEDQDTLIRKVAAANPRTIVVLNSGGPVAMPWKDGVRAVLEMWYPGQEGGWATADLLLGRASPGGKLPVTFPARLEDTPSGVADAGAVGYRWYDRQGIEPLFPFGHGLSYARFDYSRPAAIPTADGVDVRLTLSNVGGRSGSEIVQIYLGPPKALAGFAPIELGPGESRQVTIHIAPRALARWSIEKHGWEPVTGERTVFAGSSSRNLPLATRVAIGDGAFTKREPQGSAAAPQTR